MTRLVWMKDFVSGYGSAWQRKASTVCCCGCRTSGQQTRRATESESRDTAFRSSKCRYMRHRLLRTTASSPEWLRTKVTYETTGKWRTWICPKKKISSCQESWRIWHPGEVVSLISTFRWDCLINTYIQVRLSHQYLRSSEIASLIPTFRWYCLINSYVQVIIVSSIPTSKWYCLINSYVQVIFSLIPTFRWYCLIKSYVQMILSY
jgi:hypothetical protein